jgi:pseudouridine-5'-monophosphatase
MDGLLINTVGLRCVLFGTDAEVEQEDIYTECTNIALRKYGRPEMPWSFKAKLMGIPG